VSSSCELINIPEICYNGIDDDDEKIEANIQAINIKEAKDNVIVFLGFSCNR
jgi:hypothetical protein